MLSFFRSIINSKVGVIVTFVVLGVVALAFAAGDVTGLRSSTGGAPVSGDIATVGKASVSAVALRSQAQTELEGFRQQQPTLDMAHFVAQGGLDGTLERMISGLSLDQFGASQGMIVSKKAVDGQIASIPALQGPNGKFDPALYRSILIQRKLTDAQIRGDIARDTMARLLTAPTQDSAQVPERIALPYASLLLEKRAGIVGFIPTAAMPAGAAPSDADLATFYKRNVARYTVPERRIVRYALVGPAQVKAIATPTDAEIAKAYSADPTKYAATEKRTISQVVVVDQAGAVALAAKVKAGTSIAAAATAAGLEASTQTGVTKTAYAGTTSATVADAVFGAQRGAVVGPVRGTLGWIVARIDSVDQVAGRSLDQVRGEIAAELGVRKADAALGAVRERIDDALGKNTTFDEIVADQKLTAVMTPALLANGLNPDSPTAKPDPTIAPMLAAGFQAVEGDAPQLVQAGADGSFALVSLNRVVAAAPRPLPQVREAVVRDLGIERSRQAARRVAGDVLAKVGKGTPLATALSQTGLRIPGPQPLAASRAQLAQNPRGAPPVLALMFSMAQGSAKLLAAPNDGGWFVLKLDRIDAGNAAGNADAIRAARMDIGRQVGGEQAEQFIKAIRAQIGVKTDAAALARVRAELTGAGASGN